MAKLLRGNPAVVVFFLYCAASVIWSDFPAHSMRRWVKAVGDLLMVLVLLSEVDPSAALRLPSRVGFVLVPVSVLLIRYFPELARTFDPITGQPEFTGVATSKNGLGLICMLFGLASVGRFVQTRRESKSEGRTGRLFAHGIIIVVVSWLFSWAYSMTSLVSFVVAVGLVVASGSSSMRLKPSRMHLLMAVLVSGTFAVLFLGVGGGMLEAIGRDASLTGRTAIWERVLAMVRNPVLGSGFEAFWLGWRLDAMLSAYRGVNQAHNGYIEVYLNLGWAGVALLLALLLTGYRNAFARLRDAPEVGGVWYAYFFVGIVVNFTEAHFKAMSPAWVLFLLATMAWPSAKAVQTARSSWSVPRRRPPRTRSCSVPPSRRAAGLAGPSPQRGLEAHARPIRPRSSYPACPASMRTGALN